MPSEDDEIRGAPPSGVDRPSARRVKHVDEDTELRIRQDERTPDPGEHNAVAVPEEEWEQNNRRKDSATALARDQPPIE